MKSKKNFNLESIKIKASKIALLFLVLFLSASLVKSYKKTQEVKKKIAQREERLKKLEKEGEELKKKLSETQKPEFMEKQLRDKLGYAKPGEIVVILPSEEVLRSLVPKLEEEEDTLPDPNWKKWAKIFGINF